MSLRVDLQSLRLFKVVADTENIAKAAEREHIAASAISKRMSDLEAALGTKLLHRRRRGVTLTPAGFSLLLHTSRILDTLEQLEVDLAEYALGVRGHVRVMANISALVQFLPMDLSSFSSAHESVKIDVTEASTPQILSAVADGRTDVGFVWANDFPHGVQSEPYRSDELVLVVPRAHALAHRESVAFAETLDYEFVGLEPESGWNLYLERALMTKRTQLKVRIRVPSFDAALRMVEADLGISVVPLGVIQRSDPAGALRAIHLLEGWAKRTLRMCYKGFDTTLSPAARLLIEHFRERVAADGCGR